MGADVAPGWRCGDCGCENLAWSPTCAACGEFRRQPVAVAAAWPPAVRVAQIERQLASVVLVNRLLIGAVLALVLHWGGVW